MLPRQQQDIFAGVTARLMARNTLLNLAGHLVPLAVAIVAIPPLVAGLGTERFGILSLLWMVIGYFGLFDLGIGRATTKFVAEALARNALDESRDLVWTSLGTLAGFGLLGGVLLAAANHLLVTHVLRIPDALQGETHAAFFLLAVSIPLVLPAAGLRGVLEAHRRFGVLNAIKIASGVAMVLAPLAVLPFSDNLREMTAALLACRAVDLAANFAAVRLCGVGRPRRLKRGVLRRLLGFGGWLTVSNVVGPLMTYLDRFLVGAILTMSAVAYYATPYDVVTRLGILPASLLGVAFPLLCASAVTDGGRFLALYRKISRVLLVVLVPVTLVLLVFARPLLALWLGADFAAQSTVVVQLLAVGVLVNALAQVPFAALQALGRPDLTAKLHLLELPAYLLILWFAVTRLGIAGAALTWLARVLVDAVVLHWLARRLTAAWRQPAGERADAGAAGGAPACSGKVSEDVR